MRFRDNALNGIIVSCSDTVKCTLRRQRATTLLRAICFSVFEDEGRERVSSHFDALFAFVRSWLNKWVAPILTTVNVAAPYHALTQHTLLFKYIHTLCTSRAPCTRGVTRTRESATARDAASELYLARCTHSRRVNLCVRVHVHSTEAHVI